MTSGYWKDRQVHPHFLCGKTGGKHSIGVLIILLVLVMCGCSGRGRESVEASVATETNSFDKGSNETVAGDSDLVNEGVEEMENPVLRMLVGQEEVTVKWAENEAVDALKELASAKSLTIDMSMYGGFEQVGSIGTDIPRADEQITTKAGDIVLYAGDQIVVFYGENTWDYTMLGHITEPDVNTLAALLSNGDTSVTVFVG